MEDLQEHLGTMSLAMLLTLVVAGVFVGFPVVVIAMCALAYGAVVLAGMAASLWAALSERRAEREEA